MLGVDFPAQHDHPVLTPYCELHAAMFFPRAFNVLFTFSLSVIQVLRVIISGPKQKVV